MWHADPDRRAPRLARARRPLIVAAVIGGVILQQVLVGTPAPSHPPPAGQPGPTSPAATPRA